MSSNDIDFEKIKHFTLKIVSEISEEELSYHNLKEIIKFLMLFSTVTLPILREKVAESMEVSLEKLLGKEIKAIIMETFQEFLLSKSEVANEPETVEVLVPEENVKTEKVKHSKPEKTKSESKSKASKKAETEPKITKKTEAEAESKSKESKKTESKPKESKKIETESKFKVRKEPKTKEIVVSDSDEAVEISESASPVKPVKLAKPVVSAKAAQIEKLKSYVFKCGVRKVWKKELDGLNENQCIARLQTILKELGIEGKPSLELCKAIKKRREFEAELREIDTSNIIEGKRRRLSDVNTVNTTLNTVINNSNKVNKRSLIVSDSENEDETEGELSKDDVVIDLKAFGDSESD